MMVGKMAEGATRHTPSCPLGVCLSSKFGEGKTGRMSRGGSGGSGVGDLRRAFASSLDAALIGTGNSLRKTASPLGRARSAYLQPASCNRSPNHLASMQTPYRDPASEWRSARERHGQNDVMPGGGAMISADASTCPRCRTIFSRTAVAPAGIVALLAIAVLYVLLQRYG